MESEGGPAGPSRGKPCARPGRYWFFANRSGGVRDTVVGLNGNDFLDELP
ncbi:MAG: hypothetical protein K2P78_07925 [Gemmataceae bacterium]|nr:hypothetical protein [Gemmataceae bacterium]